MRVIAIAHNSFREAVRDKVFVIVAAFGLVMIASSVIMSPLTVGAREKIVADMGLSTVSMFSMLVILFVGSGMVYKEIDKRTITVILSKPVSRLEYMFGKFFGLAATLATMFVAMTALFWCACLLTRVDFSAAFLSSIFLSYMEMLLVTALMILFSSFTTPVLTSLFTLAVYIVGHLVRDLESFALVTGSDALFSAMRVFKTVLPNLDLFNIRNAVVHGIPIAAGQILWASAYAVIYAGILLVLSGLIFRRREFR
jgi:ABC-type transport system involved in multi-copper enzyme maturation permease subunit